jgi:hypothetical protein
MCRIPRFCQLMVIETKREEEGMKCGSAYIKHSVKQDKIYGEEGKVMEAMTKETNTYRRDQASEGGIRGL